MDAIGLRCPSIFSCRCPEGEAGSATRFLEREEKGRVCQGRLGVLMPFRDVPHFFAVSLVFLVSADGHGNSIRLPSFCNIPFVE